MKDMIMVDAFDFYKRSQVDKKQTQRSVLWQGECSGQLAIDMGKGFKALALPTLNCGNVLTDGIPNGKQDAIFYYGCNFWAAWHGHTSKQPKSQAAHS
jgi:hypothetical protein